MIWNMDVNLENFVNLVNLNMYVNNRENKANKSKPCKLDKPRLYYI